MTPERWQAIQHVFDHAVEMPREDRAHFLDVECANDPDLRDQVQRLLDSSDKVEGVFEKAIGGALEDVISTSGKLEKGTRIGAYSVVRVLGEGGMGTVYLAERADKQFQQKVAIKLVQSAGMDASVLTRLRSERQILANLNHPNIARLIDGGTTDDNVPYLVMEYIEGVPIDEYCDEKSLTVKDRLTIFQKICSAVHYAHQNLVVHRDIKPSNILVSESGEPKLLDFGIAKILNP